jgi:hypothetical protein
MNRSIRTSFLALFIVMAFLVTVPGMVFAQSDTLGPEVTVDKYKFKFQPPKDWKKKEGDEPKWFGPLLGGITPNLNIRSTTALPGDFQKNVDEMVKYINQGGQMTVDNSEQLVVDGTQARILYGSLTHSNIKFKSVQVIFDSKPEFVFITYIIDEPNWDKFKPVYLESAKSVKFIK